MSKIFGSMQRLVIVNGMANENPNNNTEPNQDSKPTIGSVVYMIDRDTYKAIVRESLKAQEATLNTMKLIANDLFGDILL